MFYIGINCVRANKEGGPRRACRHGEVGQCLERGRWSPWPFILALSGENWFGGSASYCVNSLNVLQSIVWEMCHPSFYFTCSSISNWLLVFVFVCEAYKAFCLFYQHTFKSKTKLGWEKTYHQMSLFPECCSDVLLSYINKTFIWWQEMSSVLKLLKELLIHGTEMSQTTAKLNDINGKQYKSMFSWSKT